jgi:hypothetical protein
MKKSRLLEIIREEISSALGEAATTYAGKTAVDDLKKDKAFSSLTGDAKADALEKLGSGGTVTIGEEDQLNEMAFALKKGIAPSEKIEPRYKKENFKKVVDLILSKVDGTKTMADVARELGVIQQKIRPVVSDLLDAGILEKGEAESKAGKDTANKPGPKSKAEPKEKAEKAPKAEPKKAEEEDDEVAAATKAISGDETAKELGKISSRKDKIVKAYRDLEPQKQDKIAKAKAGDKEAADWLKNTWTPILKAYNKAQQVNV